MKLARLLWGLVVCLGLAWGQSQQLTVSPTTLTFTAVEGGASPAPLNVQIGTNFGSLTFTVTTGANFTLTASPANGTAGPPPNTTPVTVSVNTAGLSAAGSPYSGQVVVRSPNAINSPVTVSVTVIIQRPNITVAPASLSFTAVEGGASPAAQSVQIGSTGGPFDFTVSNNSNLALTFSPSAGATPATIQVSVSTAGLTAGTYSGQFLVRAPAGNSPFTVPVTVTIQRPNLTVSPTTLSFTAVEGGASPATQSVQIGSTTGVLDFTLSNPSNLPLTFSPAGGKTPATVQVGVNTGGLAAGTYNVQLLVNAVNAANNPVPVAVTVTIQPGARLTVSPTALSFTAVEGGPNPATQTAQVGSTAGALAFTVTTTGNLALTVTPTSGTTPGAVQVAVNTAGLTAGTYSGQFVVSSPSVPNNPVTVAVTLTIQTPARLTAAPASLSFTATAGATSAPAQNMTLTSSAGGGLAFSIANQSDLNLSFQPATGTTPATIRVSLNPAGLAEGTYNGQFAITAANATNSPLSIPVTATILPAPVMTSLDPVSAPVGSAAFTLTVQGRNFRAASLVFWNETSLATSLVSATSMTAQVPASLLQTAGNASITVRTTDGVVSNALTFAVANLSIQSLNPSSVTAGGPAFDLTIAGVAIPTSSSVRVGSTALMPASVTPQQIVVRVPATVIATAGTLAVVITTPTGLTSNSLPLTVNPAPVISSLAPASATAGGAAFTLTVNGSNFLNGPVVRWNGQALPSQLVSATQMTAQVAASLIASAGSASVTVATREGVSSNAAAFQISPVMPTVSSLSLSEVTVGAQDATVTLTGTGFVDGSVVLFTPPGGTEIALTPQSVTATQIVVQLPADQLTRPGAASIRVSNPGDVISNRVTVNLALPPLPAVMFTGPATSPSDRDQQVTVALGASYPVDLTGTVILTFAGDGGLPDDPTIQLSNGSRTMTFTVPANARPNTQVMVKMGTTAGVITITPSFLAGTTNVTPPGVATQRITIMRAAPALTSVECVRRGTSAFDVTADGFTNTRAAGQATFDFQAATGASLGTTQLTVDATQPFTTRFASATGANAGGTFRYMQPFNVQGNSNDVGSVTVRLANAAGTSPSATAVCR